jgi:hypothetical protein
MAVLLIGKLCQLAPSSCVTTIHGMPKPVESHDAVAMQVDGPGQAIDVMGGSSGGRSIFRHVCPASVVRSATPRSHALPAL